MMSYYDIHGKKRSTVNALFKFFKAFALNLVQMQRKTTSHRIYAVIFSQSNIEWPVELKYTQVGSKVEETN